MTDLFSTEKGEMVACDWIKMQSWRLNFKFNQIYIYLNIIQFNYYIFTIIFFSSAVIAMW